MFRIRKSFFSTLRSKLQKPVTEQTPSQAQQKIDDIVTRSSHILYKISGVFPFDFFPNKVIIDENKIDVIIKQFFASESVHSIPISDIQTVVIDTAPFFSTMKITADGFHDEPLIIKYLPNSAATHARNIIEGLVISKREGVDFSNMDVKEVKQNIERIGHAHR